MNIDNILSLPIQVLQGAVFTPISALIAIFSVMLLVAIYHWSGLAEKVENLKGVEKIIVFFFVAFIIFVFYYIFYKAGKFDKILSYPVVENFIGKINNLINP